jgi:hypothetical protein
VRWFQFGAFCPLFRLHGHREGPHDESNQCGGTNGPNEVWNLAKDAVRRVGLNLNRGSSLSHSSPVDSVSCKHVLERCWSGLQ